MKISFAKYINQKCQKMIFNQPPTNNNYSINNHPPTNNNRPKAT